MADYKCLSCRRLLDHSETETNKENVGTASQPAFERYLICGHCRSSDVQDWNRETVLVLLKESIEFFRCPPEQDSLIAMTRKRAETIEEMQDCLEFFENE